MLQSILEKLDAMSRYLATMHGMISFPRSDARRTCILMLFLRMKSCFDACRVLLRENLFDSVYILQRSFIEAYVDLVISASSESYYKFLLLTYFRERRKRIELGLSRLGAEEAKMSTDRYLRGGHAHTQVREMIAKVKANLVTTDTEIATLSKEMVSLGIKERYGIKDRFVMAGLADEYDLVYSPLSVYVHPNMESIMEQFATVEEGGDVVVSTDGRRLGMECVMLLSERLAKACHILAGEFDQIVSERICEIDACHSAVEEIAIRSLRGG